MVKTALRSRAPSQVADTSRIQSRGRLPQLLSTRGKEPAEPSDTCRSFSRRARQLSALLPSRIEDSRQFRRNRGLPGAEQPSRVFDQKEVASQREPLEPVESGRLRVSRLICDFLSPRSAGAHRNQSTWRLSFPFLPVHFLSDRSILSISRSARAELTAINPHGACPFRYRQAHIVTPRPRGPDVVVTVNKQDGVAGPARGRRVPNIRALSRALP